MTDLQTYNQFDPLYRSRCIAMLCAVCSLFLPLVTPIVILVGMAVMKLDTDASGFPGSAIHDYRWGRRAVLNTLNFHVTMLLISVVLLALTFTIVLAVFTIPLLWMLGIAVTVIQVVAVVRYACGVQYEYPLTLKMF